MTKCPNKLPKRRGANEGIQPSFLSQTQCITKGIQNPSTLMVSSRRKIYEWYVLSDGTLHIDLLSTCLELIKLKVQVDA